MEYVTGKILDEHQRQEESKSFSNNANETALQVETAKKFVWGQPYLTGQLRPKPDYMKEERTSFFCKIKGHLKADCKKFRALNTTMVKTSISQASPPNLIFLMYQWVKTPQILENGV